MGELTFVEVPDQVSSQLTAELRAKLAERGETHVLGAQLVPLINGSLPEGWTYKRFFSPGAHQGLRPFVEHWLAGVVKPTARKRGADFFYEVAGEGQPIASATDPAGELWRTFVAVRPARKLAYDPGASSLKAVPLESTVEPPSLPIASLAVEEHKQICASFSARLKDDGHAIVALDELLVDYRTESYPAWLRILRRHSPPLDKEWGEFRQNRILMSFVRQLGELGLAVDIIEGLKRDLQRDHEASTRTRAPKLSTAVEAKADDGSTTEKRARELLRTAIDRCTYEELREIRLPFGVVLDILNGSR